MIGAKLSKSLIQFCPINKWVGLYFLPIFDLRLNYGRDNEDNGDLLQKIPCTHYYIQCPQPCNRPPLTHTSTRDSWTPMGKSGSVSCGVTAPFSWVLVCTRFCLCPPKVLPQSCVSSGSSMVGLMATSSKGLKPHPGLLHPEPLPLGQATADPFLCRRHSNSQREVWLSLFGVSWCAQSFV